MKQNRLYIVDFHDALMPYLTRMNATSTKTYATRTLLLLKDDGTLKPLVIELSLPHPQGDQLGAISKLYFPAENGVQKSIWQLAKAYVTVNDVGYHQLISHWYIFSLSKITLEFYKYVPHTLEKSFNLVPENFYPNFIK